MSCESRYADAHAFAEYWCFELCEEDEARLNRQLQLAATRINASRQASDQCSCTAADWAATFLEELNIRIAATFYNCRCSNFRMTDELKAAHIDAVVGDLELIRTGKIELCEGYAGSEYPAWGAVEQALTLHTTAGIVENRIKRERE